MLLDQTLSILHLYICQTIHFRDKENKSTRERERDLYNLMIVLGNWQFTWLMGVCPGFFLL